MCSALLWVAYAFVAVSVGAYFAGYQPTAQVTAALGFLSVLIPYMRFATTRTGFTSSLARAVALPLGALSLPWLIALTNHYSTSLSTYGWLSPSYVLLAAIPISAAAIGYRISRSKGHAS